MTVALRLPCPALRVRFSAYAEHAVLAAALDAVADGCLRKDTSRTGLVDSIKRVAAGERYLDPASAATPTPRRATAPARPHPARGRPAPRPLGETNPEIAAALSLSRNTLKSYFTSDLQRLGARNRVEAILRANDHGLLSV